MSGGVLYVPSKNGEILVFGSKDASAGSSAQWQVWGNMVWVCVCVCVCLCGGGGGGGGGGDGERKGYASQPCLESPPLSQIGSLSSHLNKHNIQIHLAGGEAMASYTPHGSCLSKVVSKDGRVLKSGTGEVPASVSSAFNFKLRPEPTARWFIMTADGTVLNQGEGTIPEKTRNLYKAFTSGKWS